MSEHRYVHRVVNVTRLSDNVFLVDNFDSTLVTCYNSVV